MSLWKIAWKSIQHRSLASTLTALSMALGVALVVTVLVINGVVGKSFQQGAQGYDLIVGAKGSKLQLVLSSVFYNQDPVGLIPYEYYENGEIVGVDIDIAREIAKELGKELVIKDVAFDSIINEVKTGKADFGAAGISYSDERAKQVSFSINYSTSKQVVIVKKDSYIKKALGFLSFN